MESHTVVDDIHSGLQILIGAVTQTESVTEREGLIGGFIKLVNDRLRWEYLPHPTDKPVDT